jgi:hypothetical protein
VASEPAERDPLLPTTDEIIRNLLERSFEDLEGKSIAPELHQGAARDAKRLALENPRRRLLGQHQNIARAIVLDRDVDPTLPVGQLLPVFVDVAEPQRPPIRLLQIRQQVIDRAYPAASPGAERCLCHLGEPLAIVLQTCRIWLAVLERIAERAFGPDIERQVVPAAENQDDAPGAERMAHAELVPGVRIIDREFGDDQISQQQLLEHVRVNVSRPLLQVGAERLETGVQHCRLDEFGKDGIEVDRTAIPSRLRAERRNDKCPGP